MVHFVGAGPGAVDLITLRGKALIEEADIIIYTGSLINPALLEYAKKDCQKYNSAYMTLEEVMEVMLSSSDKNIVRLHTGEPSIYGAIREQMDILGEHGIEFDSCPGVSAAFGAAASLNLEYTLPGISQSLIITRMEGRTRVPERESIESFASHNASMAIYLSSGMLEELSKRLHDGGYKWETPVALVYKASWPEEKIIICDLLSLADRALEEGISKTALVIVGDVVTHSGYDKSKLYSADFVTGFRDALKDI